MNIIVQVLVGLIAIFGALFFLDTGIAMNRAKDAVTRANMNSPAIYVGFPLVAFALFIGDTAMNGFSWAHIIEFLLITFIVPVGSALGSMYLGRAMMLSQVRLDPRTVREDLRDVSPATRDEAAETCREETEKHHHHLEKYSEYEEYEEYDEEFDEESDGAEENTADENHR
ncbi:cation:proton antiporter [Lawsonella clevelandensis]|uniref:cation:proton antiporter n=1 Tax=Lawsonella clevelandensis TaxID=1528099 RepID=UPI0023F5149C|nr:monovalent cation/H(+) antiporter subunit G [Lawsonella clevelandensis]